VRERRCANERIYIHREREGMEFIMKNLIMGRAELALNQNLQA
jgi:hypothetical protein